MWVRLPRLGGRARLAPRRAGACSTRRRRPVARSLDLGTGFGRVLRHAPTDACAWNAASSFVRRKPQRKPQKVSRPRPKGLQDVRRKPQKVSRLGRTAGDSSALGSVTTTSFTTPMLSSALSLFTMPTIWPRRKPRRKPPKSFFPAYLPHVCQTTARYGGNFFSLIGRSSVSHLLPNLTFLLSSHRQQKRECD